MPVKHRKKRTSPEKEQLLKQLTDEWQNPSEEEAGKPVIVLDEDSSGTHVYVVWDQWRSIPAQERSEIIMDAAETVLDPDKTLEITVAMGLTKDEAETMDIEYE